MMEEEPTQGELEEIRLLAIEFLEKLQMAGDVEVTPGEDQITISIDAGKADGLLIGRKGETLDAYEHILRRIVSKKIGYEGRILVDVGGYKERREKRLEELAQSLASRVSLSGEPQMTELLTPRERRVIHLALRDHPDVTTESMGDGSLKRVRIFLRKPEPGQAETNDES
jgi:spoIIIJ-associated protein